MDTNAKAVFEGYKNWVRNNPTVVSDVETLLTWSSYFAAGRVSKSPVVSELVYAGSKLCTLFNDRILQESYGNLSNDSGTIKNKLKLFLTVIHYCEVLVELIVRRKGSTRLKWTTATIIQILKGASALVLLYKYKQTAISYPPIPMLKRKKLAELDDVNSNVFVLKRSGKIIRRVEGAPPVALRDWQPIHQEPTTPENLSNDVISAETIHIIKPIIHLGAMGIFGTRDWKQWILSLALELWSLKIYSKYFKTLSHDQKLEISRRKLALLLYLLRSPMYESYSQNFIRRRLESVARNIPLAGYLCHPLLQYLSHWQSIYFYMWSG